MCEFLALRRDKIIQDIESQCFAERFLYPSSSKYNFTVPLRKCTVLNYCTFKILNFHFFENLTKGQTSF